MTIPAANFVGLRMVAEGLERHLAVRTSFVAETVLANAAYRALCERARNAGFAVELAYVAVRSVEESLARVRLRVASGGHDVPEKDVRRRWDLSHANLGWFARHADEVRVYDNSQWGVAPRRIAVVAGGQVKMHVAEMLPEVDRVLAGL